MAIIEQSSATIPGAIGPWYGTSAPTDGTSGTLAGQIPPGCLYLDTSSALVYRNVGTQASPVYRMESSWHGSGAPTDGTSGTFAGKILPGDQYIDTSGAVVYVNVGTQASPKYRTQG